MHHVFNRVRNGLTLHFPFAPKKTDKFPHILLLYSSGLSLKIFCRPLPLSYAKRAGLDDANAAICFGGQKHSRRNSERCPLAGREALLSATFPIQLIVVRKRDFFEVLARHLLRYMLYNYSNYWHNSLELIDEVSLFCLRKQSHSTELNQFADQ